MGEFPALSSASIFRRRERGRAVGPWKLELRYEGLRPIQTSWPTKREAQEELERVRVEAGRVVLGGPDRSFVDYVAHWSAKRDQLPLSPSTLERQRSTITTWIAPDHGRWGFTDHRIGSITAEGILDLFAEMRRQSRAERTVHKVYEVLNQILDAAVRDRWILVNPMDHLGPTERPRATRQRTPKIMTHTQVWEVFHAIRERRGTAFPDYSLLWLTAYYQGTRAGEAIALRAQDFDFDGGYFSRDNFKQRRHTGPRGLLAPMGTLLGGYVREHGITGLLWPALGSQRVDPHLTRRVVELRDEGLRWVAIGEQLGISDVWARKVHARRDEAPAVTDTPITPDFLRQQVWGPAMQALGYQFVMKDLRNSCVVNLIDGSMTGEVVEPKDVMHHVDHKSLRMTLDTYYQFRPQGRIGTAEPKGLTVEEALARFDPTTQPE